MSGLKKSKNELENELFASVYEKTPDYIKNLKLMDFDNKKEFTFILKKEYLAPYDQIQACVPFESRRS